MAHTTSSETYTCSQCSDSFPAVAAVAGSFCSRDCHDRHRAANEATRILNQLKYDHRFCFTCFRQLKTVYRPTDRWGIPDCFRGLQHRTKYANVGQKTVLKPHLADPDPDAPGRELNTTGTICQCGNTAHHHCEPAIRDHQTFECAYYFTESLQVLQAEDKLHHDVDLDQFFDSLLDRRSIHTSLTDAVQIEPD